MRLVWSDDFRKERDKTRAWFAKRRVPVVIAWPLTAFASASVCLGQTVAVPVCMGLPTTIILVCPLTWWGVLFAWPFSALLVLIVWCCADAAITVLCGLLRGVIIVDLLGIACGGALGVIYIVSRVTW